MPLTKRDLCTAALQELGVLDPTDTASDEDMNAAAGAFDRLYDAWNAQRRAVYADVFAPFTLTANLAPQTIGPTGNLVVTQRPVSIESAGLVLTSGSLDVERPIIVRGAKWWSDQAVKDLSTDVPTDLYYEPDWPNGKAFFWPVPASAVDVVLQTRMALAALALGDTFTMPPGYLDAVVLSLAEKCARPFSRPVTPDLAIDAAKARDVIFSANRVTPNIATQDAGMPRSGGGRIRTFNWLDRSL